MKKAFYLFLITLLIFAFSGCEKNTKQETLPSESNDTVNDSYSDFFFDEERDAYFNTFQNFELSFTNVVEQTDNYVIRQSEDHAGDFYKIYDNDGNLLDKGYHSYRGSFDICELEHVLQLEYGFGGTNVFPKYRFYDVEKGKVSRYFSGPVAVKDTLIAYIAQKDEKAVLVVQDIFDVDKFYREFTGTFDEMIFMDFDDLLFSDDGAKIILRYSPLNDKSDQSEEIFKLN